MYKLVKKNRKERVIIIMKIIMIIIYDKRFSSTGDISIIRKMTRQVVEGL